MLEVGVGAGIAAAALRQAGIEVTTLDLQPELKPDLLAPVTAIPTPDGAFDAVVCCQVLEHIPYADVSVALRELRRVARVGGVISMPDVTPEFAFGLSLPGVRWRRLSWSPAWFTRARRESKMKPLGHHWEIGYRGTSLRRVLADVHRAGWRVDRTWRVPEKTWHRFFLLRAV